MFEALLWITEFYSAMKDKRYFSWSYLPPHGKSCNMGKGRVDLEYTINWQCL